jgi:competence protein ComEA
MFKKLLCVLAMLTAQAAWAAVDANKADQATLETVKGIGPAVSTRILDERKKGPFKDWPDLVDRVKGVGEGLTVNGAAFTPTEGAEKPARRAPFGKAAPKDQAAADPKH